MSKTKHTGWVNLYRDKASACHHWDTFSSGVYPSEQDAEGGRAGNDNPDLIFLICVPVEWEE